MPPPTPAGPLALAAALAALAAAAPGQAAAAAIDPHGIAGARIVAGGGRLPPIVRERFVALAGGERANIVLVPTAGANVDTAEVQQRLVDSWHRDFPAATFAVLHAGDRATADAADFCRPLAAATGLWFGGGQQQRLADAYVDTRFERELLALCARGGVVGGTSAGAAIQSRTMIQEGREPPIVGTGLDLLPDAVVDQHFSQRMRLPRLRAVLQDHPGRFGVGIDESTAVEVLGRQLRVLGDGTATLLLPATGERSERAVVLRRDDVADLVTWQRAARARAGPPWPPAVLGQPVVAHGTLVLVGGGCVPAAAMARFVELAGGSQARIVMVPSATPPPQRTDDGVTAMLRDLGVADLRTFDVEAPGDVTAERLRAFADATAVWFGGGRQWRLCDALEGTRAPAAMRAVLARGGVVGGSSAGATIQGEFLVRGNPLGNAEEWCEGYDRGLGLLPGCAVDQHFVTRNRTADLQRLIAALPQLLGLGIDEATAAIVRGSVLEVVGTGTVAVFDVRHADATARTMPAPTWLAPGARWDLAAGRRCD